MLYFFDVPFDYDYKWTETAKSGPVALCEEFGLDIKFLCNSMSKICKGDLHMVDFESEEDAMIFRLKSGFDFLPYDPKMDKYLNRTAAPLRRRWPPRAG